MNDWWRKIRGIWTIFQISNNLLKTYETQNNYDKNCSGKKRNGKNILKTRKEPRNESAQKKKGKSLKEYFERWFDKMLETEKGVLKSQKLISNLTTTAL